MRKNLLKQFTEKLYGGLKMTWPAVLLFTNENGGAQIVIRENGGT
jgi:hypothetical protein